MLPYQNLIQLNRDLKTPIFLQLTNQLVKLIQAGHLSAGAKLPSSRAFAKLFDLNRNTVVRSLEELEALGWIHIQAKKGTFVVDNFPTIQPYKWGTIEIKQAKKYKDFQFKDFEYLQKPLAFDFPVGFDDGLPDVRLAPIDELAKTYARNLRQLAFEKKLNYEDALGDSFLRKNIVTLLNETRGLNINIDQVLITRGTIMAIHLAIGASTRVGDKVIIGANNYKTANMIIQHFGGRLIPVPVDEKGIDVAIIAKICQQENIRGIYVTSHHHHPTTVTLSPERRLQLLELANKYNFIIFEDDYDYDFHFDNSPVLPLASADRTGRVLYFGSFTKIIAPAFRVGYLIGPPALIQSLTKFRRILDRQGDAVLEKSIGDLLANGTIRRHLKKSLRHYKERRDYCCELLRIHLKDAIRFQKPAGGMAIWANFDTQINLDIVSKKMIQKGIYFPNSKAYNEGNGVRLGFASMNMEEIERSVRALKAIIRI